MVGFLTQPVLTRQALENLKLAHETLHGKILGGIIPIVSQRNALFMNSEVAGITVDPEIIDRYAGLDRAQGEELAGSDLHCHCKGDRALCGRFLPDDALRTHGTDGSHHG